MIAAAALTVALIATPVIAGPVPPALTMKAEHPAMTGPSFPYRGEYFRANQKRYTKCILLMESRYHYFSTTRAAGYFGGFQFNKPLKRGATWMMTPELKDRYGKAEGKAIAAKLRGIEMHKWHPFFQHMAFFTVLNWTGDASGEKHWSFGSGRCATWLP